LNDLVLKADAILAGKKPCQTYQAEFVVERAQFVAFRTQVLAYLTALLGADATYTVQFGAITNPMDVVLSDAGAIETMQHVLRALKEDIEQGHLQTFRELVSAELFSDFVEMAQHLLDEHYKDAAAVIAGSVLEEHLRQLAAKNGISTTYTDSKGRTQAKSAEMFRTELATANVYTQTQAKQALGWLAIRNDAAHGHYDKYTEPEVKNMIQGIIDFMVRFPA
jgi:hypothetical protein